MHLVVASHQQVYMKMLEIKLSDAATHGYSFCTGDSAVAVK